MVLTMKRKRMSPGVTKKLGLHSV